MTVPFNRNPNPNLYGNRNTNYNNKRYNNRQKEAEHHINEYIRVPQVRLVGDNVKVGIYLTSKALEMARNLGLDLVEISPETNPPVCKIIDYKKFLYIKKKKEKEQKAHNKQAELKEIRITPSTDQHDFNFKAKHGEEFLKDNHKVKVLLQFKGRGIMYKEQGEIMLLKFIERLADVGQPETLPKLEGKRMFVVLIPKVHHKKKDESINS